MILHARKDLIFIAAMYYAVNLKNGFPGLQESAHNKKGPSYAKRDW